MPMSTAAPMSLSRGGTSSAAPTTHAHAQGPHAHPRGAYACAPAPQDPYSHSQHPHQAQAQHPYAPRPGMGPQEHAPYLHYPSPVLPPGRAEAQRGDALDREYAVDRLTYLRAMEDRRFETFLPPFSGQTQITWKMRKTLVLWVIEVHCEYELSQESLHLAINLLDRVSCVRIVPLSHYQLLGLTCLWLACKYEENHGRVPLLKNLVHLCCECYSKQEFKEMELAILKDVSFDLSHPTPESFLKANCFIFMSHMSDIAISLARYIMELTLVHSRFAGLRPSLIAAASLLLADEIMNNKYTNFENKKLSECMDHLAHCLVSPPPQLITKYASPTFHRSSRIAQMWVDKARNHSSRPPVVAGPGGMSGMPGPAPGAGLGAVATAGLSTPSLLAAAPLPASNFLGLPSPPKELGLEHYSSLATAPSMHHEAHGVQQQQQPEAAPALPAHCPDAASANYPTPVLMSQSLGEMKVLPPLPTAHAVAAASGRGALPQLPLHHHLQHQHQQVAAHLYLAHLQQQQRQPQLHEQRVQADPMLYHPAPPPPPPHHQGHPHAPPPAWLYAPPPPPHPILAAATTAATLPYDVHTNSTILQ